MKPAWIEFPSPRHGEPPIKCRVQILSAGKDRSTIRYVDSCTTANAGDVRTAPNHALSDRKEQAKPYARMPFDEAAFQLALSCFKASRTSCFDKWTASPTAKTDAKEDAFYKDRIAELDKLIAQFEARLVADTSQDAEEDENEEV